MTEETMPVEDDGIIDPTEYDIPVVEDDSDDRFPAFIAGSTLIVRLEDVGELRIPLKLTYATLKDLKAGVAPDSEELDQLVWLLEKIGDTELVNTLTTEVDLADALAIGVLFFRAWKQRTSVSLGKLRGSSRR